MSGSSIIFPGSAKAGPKPKFDPFALRKPKEEEPKPKLDPFGLGLVDKVEINTPQRGGELQVDSGMVTTADVEPLSNAALSSARESALKTLPPTVAGAFSVVWDAMEGPASRTQLVQLQERGSLTDVNKDQTTLEYLAEMATKPRASGIDGANLARQTVAALASPDLEIDQGKTFTCGATNSMRQLADQPAAFARVAVQLSQSGGEAQLGGEHSVNRVSDSVGEDNSGRNTLEKLIQGAFMQHAGGPESGAYSGYDDIFSDGTPGLKPLQIARLTASLQDENQAVLYHDSKSTKELRAHVQNLAEGESFQVGGTWTDREHMRLVTGFSEGNIQYYDPDPSNPRSGSEPMHDFLWKTAFAVLGEEQIQAMNLDPDAQVYRVGD